VKTEVEQDEDLPKYQFGRRTAFGSLPRKTDPLKKESQSRPFDIPKNLSSHPHSQPPLMPRNCSSQLGQTQMRKGMWVRCCLCLKEIDAVTCNQSQVGAQLSSDSVLCVGCVLRPEALPALLAQPACPKKRKLTKDPDLAPYTSGTLATSSMTRNEEEYYSRGFQQGFLAGMNHIQTCATGSLHGPGTMRQDAIQQELASNARASNILTRRPYRFCTRCWIKTKKWVLKSLKLPNGSIAHLHPFVCPSWDNPDEEPTKEQIKLYGAAFKRAQRSSTLQNAALGAFKTALPDVTDSFLRNYLMS